MKIKQKSTKQVSNKYTLILEPAFQSMYISAIFISFCLAIIITTTVTRPNWGTAVFAILTIVLVYLKKETYLTISEESINFRYFAGLKKDSIEIIEIDQIILTDSRTIVKLKRTNQAPYIIYMPKAAQEQLALWAQQQKISLGTDMIEYSKKD
ncbi:EbsA family protein [Marinilactibacillus sp. Marseille-P9653]|uniref:EbsA family protein n=1 Tax=Marinilactibacillus sp. Marseille-P9653 TaxID=2866583 RepID=UPI001CE3C4CB|nr:EbsA family protein [Marinilactibacillus sp. Marseille-P9653]